MSRMADISIGVEAGVGTEPDPVEDDVKVDAVDVDEEDILS